MRGAWLGCLCVLLSGCPEDRLPDYRRDAGRGVRPDASDLDAGPGFDSGPRPDAAAVPPGVERRCLALGEACRCSEPLETNGWGVVAPDWADPADSPPDTECRGETGEHGAVWLPRSALTTVPAFGMPGASTVEEVWRYGGVTGEARLVGDWPSRSASQRLCVRVYTRFASDYQSGGEGACADSTQLTLAFRGDSETPASRVRLFDRGGAFRLEALDFGGIAQQTPAAGGDVFGTDVCETTWCRVEACLSGDLEGGTGISFEAWITTTGGREQQWSATLGNATMGRVRRVHIADMTREGDCRGARHHSHAMQAEWEANGGERIGPAAEIEGTGAF